MTATEETASDAILLQEKKSDAQVIPPQTSEAADVPVKRKKSSSIDVIVGAQNMKETLKKQADNKKTDGNDLDKAYQTEAHKLTFSELQSTYKTNLKTGLTTAGHAELLEEYGPNQLSPSEQSPWWIKLLIAIFGGFFNILLWSGSILCFVAYAVDSADNEFPDKVNLYLGIVLGVVVCLTGIFSYFQESKSDAIMESFKSFQAELVITIRDGQEQEIDALQLVPGDVVRILVGQNLPCDVRIIECSPDAKVDNSSLTGESDPIARGVEKSHDSPMETKNLSFFGTSLLRGSFTGMVINTGDHTLMGRIAKLADSTESEDTPLAKEIKSFVTKISGLAIFLGVLFFIISVIKDGEVLVKHVVFIIGIIVANVPEGLLATVTVSLTLTAKRMAGKQVLVKNLEAVETLGSTSVICSDKTGTLTTNVMTVAHCYYSLKTFEVDTHQPIKGEFDTDNQSFQNLVRIGSLCSNAEVLADGNLKGDASERAFLKFCTPHVGDDMNGYRQVRPKLHEIAFNSANKWQVSIHGSPDNNPIVVLKGAPERVLRMCDRYEVDGEVHPLTDEIKQTVIEGNLGLGSKGERVLGFAHLPLDGSKFGADYAFSGTSKEEANWPFNRDGEEGLIFVGLLAMIDPPRPGVPLAVSKCQSAGIKVIMVTGDHPVTAHAIAKKVGIIRHPLRAELALERGVDAADVPEEDVRAIVVSGKELEDEYEKDEDSLVRFWNRALNKDSVVFARTSPQQKLLIVRACQERGGIVAVTGDGVNDSPALKQADIGVAMNITGTDVAKNAADMILLDDNFASIVNGVEEGRIIFDNLKKSIAYTLSSNIPEIMPFLFNVVAGIPLPLPTVMILLVDLGTDMMPAISMAHEGKEADIMQRSPRNPITDKLVTWRLISFSYLQIGVLQAIAGFYTYFAVFFEYGFNPAILFGLDSDSEFAPTARNKKAESQFLFINKSGSSHTYSSAAEVSAYGANCDVLSNSLAELTANCCPESYKSGGTCQYYDGGTFDSLNPFTVGEVGRRQEILRLSNSAYFTSIIVVQWADLMICKTRSLSIYQQGMTNKFMNYSLIFETVLGCILVYVPFLNPVFQTEPIMFKHWMCAVPFMIIIFAYDELRKWWIRGNRGGWLERTTYW